MASLRRTLASLYVIQAANFAVPLLTQPWLTRALGVDGYGRLNFALAVVAYFVLLADYGFNLSATRQIAVQRDDKAARSRTFWATLGVKALLAFVGGLMLLVLAALSSTLGEISGLLALGYLAVIGSVLTPTWYFQGVERADFAALATLLPKALAIPLIVAGVRGPADLPAAMLLTAAPGLLSGLWCLAELARSRAVAMQRPALADLRAALADGWHVFVSTAAISLYTTSNTVLLGWLSGPAAVGHFAAADKLLKAAQAATAPVSQALFPRVSHLMHHDRAAALCTLRRLLKWQGAFTFAVSVGLFVLAPVLVRLLYGEAFEAAVEVVRWMAPLPCLIGLSNVFGIQTLLPLGREKLFSRILLVSGVVNLGLLALLAPVYGAPGAAIAVTITEAGVTALMGWAVRAHFAHRAPVDAARP
ncbi:MAG TPA: flippase [Rhodocyclaceae bacterium]|nr:flippase [Rhodocyclaceae bacterium]